MRIDLHAHTTASDGMLAPEALVRHARERGVGILGVADHDSTSGLDPAIAAGRESGVDVIPAVEINTDIERGEIHMLGYFIDHRLDWFQNFLMRLQEGRLHRAERMVQKLAALGVHVPMERVLSFAGGGAVGRPHVARALLEAGHVSTISEAFDRYIGRTGPAYAERLKVTPAQAAQIIRHAGGVPVLAHPGWFGSDDGVTPMVESLLQAGLEGIEVYYPDHTPSMVQTYLDVAKRFTLLVTGGTDFHGAGLATQVDLGSQYVPPEVVDALRARADGRRGDPQAPVIRLETD